MSFKAMIWIQDNGPKLSHREMAVLYVLARYADQNGHGSFPFRRTIAEKAQISKASVTRALGDLEERGIIVRGDQSLAEQLTAQNRPVVWDLATDVEWVADDGSRADTTPGSRGDTTPGSTVSHKEGVYEGVSKEPSSTAAAPRQEKATPIEQQVTEWAYEQLGKAFNFIAVRGIVKWAIHDRGSDPRDVANALVAIHRDGRPITKQVLDQRLPKSSESVSKVIDRMIDAGEQQELGKFTGVVYADYGLSTEPDDITPSERRQLRKERWQAWARENREKLIRGASTKPRAS